MDSVKFFQITMFIHFQYVNWDKLWLLAESFYQIFYFEWFNQIRFGWFVFAKCKTR